MHMQSVRRVVVVALMLCSATVSAQTAEEELRKAEAEAAQAEALAQAGDEEGFWERYWQADLFLTEAAQAIDAMEPGEAQALRERIEAVVNRIHSAADLLRSQRPPVMAVPFDEAQVGKSVVVTPDPNSLPLICGYWYEPPVQELTDLRVALLFGHGTTRDEDSGWSKDFVSQAAWKVVALLFPKPTDKDPGEWDRYVYETYVKPALAAVVAGKSFVISGKVVMADGSTKNVTVTFYGSASQFGDAFAQNHVIVYAGHAEGDHGSNLYGVGQKGAGAFDCRYLAGRGLMAREVVFARCYSKEHAQQLAKLGVPAWGTRTSDTYSCIDEGYMTLVLGYVVGGKTIAQAMAAMQAYVNENIAKLKLRARQLRQDARSAETEADRQRLLGAAQALEEEANRTENLIRFE